jgi:hypothetical protein
VRFRFLLSDQHGDIALSAEDLEQPFLINPSEKHPFLTLTDYFGTLQQFITQDDGKVLKSVLKERHALADISEVILRSEKHGAFYHIASVEIIGLNKKTKLAVTTALSETARSFLAEEAIILQKLADIEADFLPTINCKESLRWQAASFSEKFFMVLGEWFDGYHEWHLSNDPKSGDRRINLWDYKNGYRFLTNAESFELLRQVALILTIYYDQVSFRQIYPWHHGAGDFIVNAESGTISVKLITARQYQPLVHFEQAEEADRLVAAIQFLLNLCLRMRLDRLDGVGEPAWMGVFAVHAAVNGFFAGLAATQAQDRLSIGPIEDFLKIMQSFETKEIYDMHESLLEIYAEEDQDDFRLIQAKLPGHAADLHEALQGFSLERT